MDLYQQALDNNAGFADKLNQEKETLGMLKTSSPDVKLLVDIYKRTHDEILEFKEYINNKQKLGARTRGIERRANNASRREPRYRWAFGR